MTFNDFKTELKHYLTSYNTDNFLELHYLQTNLINLFNQIDADAIPLIYQATFTTLKHNLPNRSIKVWQEDILPSLKEFVKNDAKQQLK